ncbi:DEKNAAC100402 [Brettanomyces naardenensis]|uniref:DEKNAAC100402 n=1 Tax=Brettanomyces naardenensis TaxID=13370 RepID=A0A448YFE9_BRENA|nr:DEKNAAC100402 [Brettanomyces naardenensis]
MTPPSHTIMHDKSADAVRRANADKENTVDKLKTTTMGSNRNSHVSNTTVDSTISMHRQRVNTYGHIPHARTSNLSSGRRRKTALRTKSSNSILSSGSELSTAQTRPDLFASFQQASTEDTENFNKAQRISNSIFRTKSGLKLDLSEDKENSGFKKLKVPRDSPEFDRITHRKLNTRDPFEEETLKDTKDRQLALAVQKEEEDDDDDEIEIVPQRPKEVIEDIPDGYQPIPKDIVAYALMHGVGVEKKSLEKFNDPLELDLSNIREDDEVLEEVGDVSELGLDLKLEFPEFGEETEEKKLAKIKEYYEKNRGDFKPKRI